MDDLAIAATQALRAVADPEDAPAMARYMKTEMPFLGVKSPARKTVLRDLVARFPVADHATYLATASSLWALPHREEKYLAIGWARAWPDFVVPASMDLYERFVVEGAWWDFVDEVAAHLVGTVLHDHREELRPVMQAWVADPDMWKRRTAILSQLRHGADTDRDMLFDFCLRRAHEDEFFVRKAIGWALRQYARTDPDAVRTFVLEHRDDWSGLTFREATKHLAV